MWKSSIGLLRGIGIIEGISYLVLLFIAMPLKYFADLPIFVQIFGMAHGILFVLFVLTLLIVWFFLLC
jgi:integral membrane protein